MPTFTDQLNNTIQFNTPPKRIISLVPSQTELLADLGLEKEVVGITKFCTHPESWYRTKVRVGGTKQVHLDRIDELQPDLIIGNKEENERGLIESLAKKYPVWMSDIKTLSDALDMIRQVGKIVDREQQADELARSIQVAFDDVKALPSSRPKAAYFIWRKPYMVAANDTFIHEMLQQSGFDNAFAHLRRYPEMDMDTLKEANPEVLLLSSEPFPFKEQHLQELSTICPTAKVMLVDGTYFSWYGSRLLQAPAYFKQLRAQL
jgi:ABC-type Fe3+-hydroxamate transport system substrate-binding protein